MKRLVPLLADFRGSAAVEMALVLPVMLTLMLGSAETGNYFVNEHSLVKAVRDGARFAARQGFSNYGSCSGSPGGTVVTDTQNVVMNGYYSGGTGITPNIKATDITLVVTCQSTVGGQQMKGIYTTRDVTGDGNPDAQIVTVTAAVTYQPIISSVGFGFDHLGIKLNASSQAAVMGI